MSVLVWAGLLVSVLALALVLWQYACVRYLFSAICGAILLLLCASWLECGATPPCFVLQTLTLFEVLSGRRAVSK
jgi:hypothetical protein